MTVRGSTGNQVLSSREVKAQVHGGTGPAHVNSRHWSRACYHDFEDIGAKVQVQSTTGISLNIDASFSPNSWRFKNSSTP